jgi:hypothetical protein
VKRYPYICVTCHTTRETTGNTAPLCFHCGKPMKPDWKAKGVSNNFTPTRGK